MSYFEMAILTGQKEYKLIFCWQVLKVLHIDKIHLNPANGSGTTRQNKDMVCSKGATDCVEYNRKN
jgi:hypothetical protein